MRTVFTLIDLKMRLTTKGQFAVAAMLDLALYSQDGTPVSLSSVSGRQNISQAYLEQIFGRLRRAGLVESVRGSGGGYILMQSADCINIAQIVAAVENKLDARLCAGAGGCHGGAQCIAHHLWSNLNQTVENYLSGLSLADVIGQSYQTTKE